MPENELIDLEVYIRLRQNAPQVTVVPADVAGEVVKAMANYCQRHPAHTDLNGRKYWQASLRELLDLTLFRVEVRPAAVGMACRMMGLSMQRLADGYHAAWSEDQLKILLDYFKV